MFNIMIRVLTYIYEANVFLYKVHPQSTFHYNLGQFQYYIYVFLI